MLMKWTEIPGPSLRSDRSGLTLGQNFSGVQSKGLPLSERDTGPGLWDNSPTVFGDESQS